MQFERDNQGAVNKLTLETHEELIAAHALAARLDALRGCEDSGAMLEQIGQSLGEVMLKGVNSRYRPEFSGAQAEMLYRAMNGELMRQQQFDQAPSPIRLQAAA